MTGKHGHGVIRIVSTVCIGASLVAGGWSSSTALGSTAAVASGGAATSAAMFMRAYRNRPSPGYQFGLSKAEQDYIYGPSDIGASHVPGIHAPRGPLVS